MKEAVVIFKHNRNVIENFIRSTIELNELNTVDGYNCKSIFNILPSLELTYMVDKTFVQITPYYYKDRIDDITYGLSKKQLFSKIKIQNDVIFVSNPYVSSHTGNMCITAAKPVEDGYLIFDFNLISVLKSMSLIELNKPFDNLSKIIYGLIGFSLLVMALVLLVYGAKILVESILLGGFSKK